MGRAAPEPKPRELDAGSRLGHFEITRIIGAGGMGVVYEARDLRLERAVALKVLSPDRFENTVARERFIREAQLAAAITHPNVAAIHEVDEEKGTPFIAMELVPGRDVKTVVLTDGPLPLRDVLSLGRQVCGALEAAHRLGIMHRDIKSSNIVVTPSGDAKVLDFGLAKAFATTEASYDAMTRERIGSPDSSPRRSSESVTAEGTIVGTPSYVSPEQASGSPLDARSDLFSLGIVLYEAATGELPFRGDSDEEVLDAIKHGNPTPLRLDRPVPSAFSRVIAKCLSKRPEERYRSARELSKELTRLEDATRSGGSFRTVIRKTIRPKVLLGLAAFLLALLLAKTIFPPNVPPLDPPNAIRVLAVLPFENLSDEPQEDYLATAVPMELTSRLGKVGALKVIPWTFMKRFREGTTSLAGIGQLTGAHAVLEGTVQIAPPADTRSKPRTVRVNAQLFDTGSGIQVWSDAFESELGDFMSLQATLAQQIAQHIQVKLERREEMQISLARRVSPEAMELYLRGREALEQRRETELREAVRYFRGALDVEPLFPEAHAGMADAYVLLGVYSSSVAADEAYRQVTAAASAALKIDPDLADAWISQAFAKQMLAWDWDGAENDFRRALELSPNSPRAHHWYADYLSVVGRHGEAIAHSKVAEDRVPLSAVFSRDVAWCYFYARRYEDAVSQLKETLELDSAFIPARTLLGRVYLLTGEYEKAISELTAAGDGYLTMLAMAHAVSGNGDEARRLLDDVKSRKYADPAHPFELALVHAALGETDRAFEWLEHGFEMRDPTMVNLKSNPLADALRGDPRYEDLVRRMGFPN